MFAQPVWLVAIPLLLMLLVWILAKNFVGYDTQYRDDAQQKQRQIRARRWMLVSRSIILILLVLAIATPTLQNEFLNPQDPRIIVLTDESTSMQLFEETDFIDQLKEQAQVREYQIAQANTSSLSEQILSRLEPGGHVVLLSDGQHTGQGDLSSVASYAANIQATINYVDLSLQHQDTSVSIQAENVVVENTPTTITIDISSTNDQPVEVEIYHNQELYDTVQIQDRHSYEESFSQGSHAITARITQQDYFAENNQYHTVLTATPRPKILFVGSQTNGLYELLGQLYTVERVNTLPTNLDEYATIILNDVPRSAVRAQEQQLQEYLTRGGGLFVVGGENSYEFGGYQNTLLEAILPVRIGAGANQQASSNIAVAIDLSGSTLGGVERIDGEFVQTGEQTQNVQKALAIDLIQQLNANNRVGALGFTYPQPRSQQCTGACVLAPIRPLGEHREEMADNIARVDITGGTAIAVGMQGALQMVQRTSGAQSIVLISDGVTGEQDQQQALSVAQTFAARGGKLYTVHVGNSERGLGFLQRLAQAGNGIVFSADRNNRLAVLFGEPEQQEQEDAYAVIAVDEYDFITQDITSSATLFGYNQVLVKDAAQQLLTSSSGQPVLSKWNYGVGRVATLTAYSGDTLGNMLQAPNSKYLSRTVNWAIGPLERVQQNLVYAQQARVGEDISISAIGSRPTIEGLTFSRIDTNEFEARIEGRQAGIYELANTQYAVNRPQEYDAVGISQELIQATQLTGGQAYSPQDIQGVITHAQTLAEIKDIEQEPLRWPFVLAALIVYVLEITIRRMQSLKSS